MMANVVHARFVRIENGMAADVLPAPDSMSAEAGSDELREELIG